MKKILSIVLAGLTLFLMGSCSKEIGPVYNPENAVPPVLGDLVLAADDSLRDGTVFGTITFAAADYGVNAAVRYTLYVDLAGNEFANAQSIANTTSRPDSTGNISIEIKGKDLNNALMTLNCEPLVATSIDLRVVAEMMGTATAIEGTSVVSESKNITVIPYNAEKTYPVVYVIGSYNGWDHAKDMYLFSYAEDKENYVGVIDFGAEHAENAFKLTGAPAWDDATGNWGLEDNTTAEAEAKTLTLINGGGSQDIKSYTTYRYYAFHFVKSSLVLNMLQGFDQVGLIGLNGDWDNDIVMEQQKSNQVFWADIQVAEATNFKFRLNADWAINWGGTIDELAAGADNIPVEPGNYRVYLDLNDFAKPTARLSTADYGKNNDTPEPPVEEPKVEGWGVIGSFAASNWETDIIMKELPAGSGVWVSAPIEFTEGDEYKLRFKGDWAENVGMKFEQEGLLVEDTTYAQPGGHNIIATETATRVVVYDTKNEALFLLGWGIVGQVEGTSWDYDVPMYKNADGKYEAFGVTVEGEFKLRYSGGWDVNYGLGEDSLAIGVATPLVSGGANMKAEGKFDFVFDPTEGSATITAIDAVVRNKWGVVGSFAASGWNADVYMNEFPAGSGIWMSAPVTLAENDEYKIRFNNDWGVNRGNSGSEYLKQGIASTCTQDGGNFKATAEQAEVPQVVVYNSNDETMYMLGWGVVGQVEGSNWDADVPMLMDYTGNITAKDVQVDGECKLRWMAGWDINRGLAEGVEFATGVAMKLSAGGGNIKATPGVYDITYNEAEETVTFTAK